MPARALGVRIRTGVRVTGFEVSARREVTAVLTDAGRIATEVVVNAAGIWAPQVAAMVGGFIPSTPVDHQHIALKAVPGHELPRDMPCFRDPDNLVYGKSEHGGMVFGGYETDPVSRWEDGVPWEHAARSLPADYERFAPLMAGAIRRFPFLADAEAIRLVCHPDAMTPDANPLARAAAGRPRVLGRGRALAQRVRRWRRDRPGDGRLDHDRRPGRRHRARIGRGGSATSTATRGSRPGWRARRTATTTACAIRTTRTWPAGPRRLSALHGRLQEAGAVFGTKAGWERADHHEPGRPWRRAGRDQAGYGWTQPPWFDRVVAEALAVRDRAGIIDLSSFGKIAVDGPGALGLLQRVSANDIDRPVGSVTYTQWCDERGGIVADVTVTRLADDRFRVVTGAGYVASEVAWLRTHAGDDIVAIRDVSGDLATIGLWGPQRPGDPVGRPAPTTSPTRRSGRAGCGPSGRRGAGRGRPDQLRGRARLGADDGRRLGRRRLGRHPAPAWRRARAVRLPRARRRSGWRRATATTAPT